MRVVFAIPVAEPAKASETFAAWKSMGYGTAALVDSPGHHVDNCDLRIVGGVYKGYADAVNKLCRAVDAEWVCTGGADFQPDPFHAADQIADECEAYFSGTFGVMGPQGDTRFDSMNWCVPAPWFGREWIRRAYMGNGPLWPGYFHYADDVENRLVAEREGRLWLRKDIVQKHEHWSLAGNERPSHLTEAGKRWAESHRLLEWRKAHGFPGSEFLPE